MSPLTERKVLITGCSDGGLGAGLARAFHARGLRVLATARNLKKTKEMDSLGVETLELDVLSDESIKSCVAQVSEKGGLDILINNAGGGYNMPVADIDIPTAKRLFDLNVWSYISVTQAFLPLLIQSKGMIVNNTSVSSVCPTPHNSVYHASKAAAAMFSDHQRIELAPFRVRVVDLKTGSVKSRFHANRSDKSTIPEGSIYAPVKRETELAMSGELFLPTAMELDEWAGQVVGDLLQPNPSARVWRGTSALKVWLGSWASHTAFDGLFSRMAGLDVLAKKLG